MIKIDFKEGIDEKFCNDIVNHLHERAISLSKNKKLKCENSWYNLTNPIDEKIFSDFSDIDNLRQLILLKPNEIQEIIPILKICWPSLFDTSSIFYKFIYNLFVVLGYDKIKKYDFIKNIDIRTCPYCNRSFIFTLDKAKNLKPEIDHFYPKSIYPIFAVSFYNLIPSCPTCNGIEVKGSIDSFDKKMVNPYLLKTDDFQFNMEITSVNVFNPLSNRNLESIKINFLKKIQSHLTVFKLDLLYDEHKDIALELFIKSKLEYNDHYRNFLKSFEDFKFSDDEINQFIIGTYSKVDDIHKRPLAKFQQDIARQLGLIK